MALSVLQMGGGYKSYCLWDDKSERCILNGTQEELFQWKHILEEVEQAQANAEHFEKLRLKYMRMLVSAGNPPSDAECFLKKQMPFLFNN